MEISSLLLPPSPVHSQHSLPPVLCVSFQFVVYSVVFFFAGEGSVCLGGYAGLSQGWLGEYHLMLGAHLLVCRMSPKQVWCWQLVAQAAHLFSQCNVAWRSFPCARGLGCQSFDSPRGFISAKHGSSVSARIRCPQLGQYNKSL
jgi:hypothetical protein